MKKSTIRNLSFDGYMTIEASFIIPLAFICFIVTILFTFFLYNHLITYQSCYIAALRGSQMKNVTDSAIEQYVKENLEKLLNEQVYQRGFEQNVNVGALSIFVNADTNISNPLYRFELYKEKELKGSREVSVNRIDPVGYIRNMERF